MRRNDIQIAYQQAISATSKSYAPWFIMLADKKWFTRLTVSEIIVNAMEKLESTYPGLSKDEIANLKAIRKKLADV